MSLQDFMVLRRCLQRERCLIDFKTADQLRVEAAGIFKEAERRVEAARERTGLPF